MKTTLKRVISLLICLTLALSAFSTTCLAASKTSGSCGKNATWSYSKKNKTLTISGTGKIKCRWRKAVGDKKVKVIIQEGITAIGSETFSMTNVRSISLPQSLTSIGSFAFGGLDAGTPTSITIPKNVKKIGKYAFGCGRLKSIKVEKGNKKFTSQGGILYNKKKTTLIRCPDGKRFKKLTIPGSVKTLAEGSFDSCDIKELRLPASVTTLQEGAFYLAAIHKVYFSGHVPAGAETELVCEDEYYIDNVYFPVAYYDEWNACQKKISKESDSETRWWYY